MVLMSGGVQKGLCGVEVPGQQFVDPVDRVFGDPREHVAQVSLRVEPAQRGGADQTVHRGRPLAAGIRSCEEKVLPIMSSSA